jgi:hypothetical protein
MNSGSGTSFLASPDPPGATNKVRYEHHTPLYDVGQFLTRVVATQNMSITMRCHPFGPGQVTIERTPRAFWFTIRVDVQNDPRNFPPVGAFSVSIKQSQIRPQMAIVIPGQRGRGWRLVGDIWIQRRFVRRHPGIIISDKGVKLCVAFDFRVAPRTTARGSFLQCDGTDGDHVPFRVRLHPRTMPLWGTALHSALQSLPVGKTRLPKAAADHRSKTGCCERICTRLTRPF